ncbi:MAG: hypothetical protein ABR589_00450 [Chthoniobacterales bacterium]
MIRFFMVADILHLLEARPFVPFAIVTSSGQRYRVPTTDHIGFNPKRTRVIVYFDDDGHVPISPLHITAVEVEPASA